MVDPQHAAVYSHILQKAQQLGDHQLELMIQRKLQPARPRPRERIIATPTGCVIFEFPSIASEAAFSPPRARRRWFTVLGCLGVYPGSFLVLLMLAAFLT